MQFGWTEDSQETAVPSEWGENEVSSTGSPISLPSMVVKVGGNDNHI